MTSCVKIAAFDVCGTIYDSNTTFDFLKYYFKDNKSYSVFRRFTSTPPIILINKVLVFLFKIDLVRTLATFFLRNERLDNIEKAGERFVTGQLRDRLISQTVELLKGFKNRGYRIILISASYDFVVKFVAKEVGADAFYASVLSHINDRSKGTYQEDLLYKKPNYILSEYKDIEEFVLVTDNKSDLDLIRLADITHVVTSKKNTAFWIKKGIPGDNLIVL